MHLTPFYCAFGGSPESSYLGAAPRFALLHLFHSKLIPKAATDAGVLKLVTELMERALSCCVAPLGKEKMFLHGKNKLRLKLWQFLLAFPV